MKQHFKKITVAVLTVLLLTIPVGAQGRLLIPGGCTVGIKLVSEGLVVTGFEQESSAEQAGLKKGDVIIQVDGAEIHTVAALQESLDEDTVVLTVLRNGKEAEFCVKPRQTAEGEGWGRMCAILWQESALSRITIPIPGPSAPWATASMIRPHQI